MAQLRKASHAGTWYESSKESLVRKFKQSLGDKAREECKSPIIVSPHAGYDYSLPQILSSFKHLKLSEATKTVIVIGPSHTRYFENQVKLSQFDSLQTPLGNLQVDTEGIEKLIDQDSYLFSKSDMTMELKEHSLEMQYPVLKYLFDEMNLVHTKVIPLVISHFDGEELQRLVTLLFKVVDPKSTSIVVSCDFTHWGGHFEYYDTFHNYVDLMSALKYKEPMEIENCVDLEIEDAHEEVDLDTGVKFLDLGAMLILSNYTLSKTMYDTMKLDKFDSWSTSLQEFKQKRTDSPVQVFSQYLQETGATICGKWPLLFTLYLLEEKELVTDFKLSSSPAYRFVDYNKSSKVENKDDSSVSYVSGYVV